MAWSATLASNATTSAAPALYVAVTMAEKERRKVSPREFLKYSLPYVAISLAVQYVISLPIWGIR
jgi:Na+/H+ antiporter NhaD/arsenite permease-like protein